MKMNRLHKMLKKWYDKWEKPKYATVMDMNILQDVYYDLYEYGKAEFFSESIKKMLRRCGIKAENNGYVAYDGIGYELYSGR